MEVNANENSFLGAERNLEDRHVCEDSTAAQLDPFHRLTFQSTDQDPLLPSLIMCCHKEERGKQLPTHVHFFFFKPLGALMCLSMLRIWCCHCSGAGLIPSPGTSGCCRSSQIGGKKKSLKVLEFKFKVKGNSETNLRSLLLILFF